MSLDLERDEWSTARRGGMRCVSGMGMRDGDEFGEGGDELDDDFDDRFDDRLDAGFDEDLDDVLNGLRDDGVISLDGVGYFL